jgi:hypothetical protein
MAITVVNLTDTFDEWRVKTNTLGTNTGDLTTLSTTAKGTLVAAINEIFSNDSDDMENVVDDTSPELGGDLVLNSNDITGTGDINTTGTLTVSGIITGTAIAATVNGTTQAAGNNTTLLATTAFVTAAVTSEDTIEEMNDTTISGSANLDLLQYNSSSSVWENKAIGSVVGATQAAGNNSTLLATTAFVTTAVTSEDQLSEMNDVTITSIANDHILQYNSTSSVWENTVLSAGVSIDDATALAIALG